jgi:putative lysine transport system permease protein
MSLFDWIIKLFQEYWVQFLNGTKNTITMALTGTIAGFVIGLLIAVIRTIPITHNDSKIKKIVLKTINALLAAYVEIVRGTPMLVQALIVHYSIFVKIGMPSLISAIIIISFNTGAYMAEIVRGGIMSIDKGQFEGASAVGMNHWQTMIHVIIPQVIRNILPAVGNEFVINIKDTSVLNVIGVVELYYQAEVVAKATWETFPVYAIICVLYFIMTFTITRLLRLLEKLLDGKEHYTLNSEAEVEA